MSSLRVQVAVLVLMLAALPLTNIGTSTGAAWVSALGLLAIGGASLVPPVLRWIDDDEDEEAVDDHEAD